MSLLHDGVEPPARWGRASRNVGSYMAAADHLLVVLPVLLVFIVFVVFVVLLVLLVLIVLIVLLVLIAPSSTPHLFPSMFIACGKCKRQAIERATRT